MTQSPGERRFLALLIIFLGLAALVLSAVSYQTGAVPPDQMPLPVLMAFLAIYAGYASLTFHPRRGWK